MFPCVRVSLINGGGDDGVLEVVVIQGTAHNPEPHHPVS